MRTIEIEISELDEKVLLSDMASVDVWANNVIRAKINVVSKAIVKSEIDRMKKDPEITTIPADDNVILAQAEIKTAVEKAWDNTPEEKRNPADNPYT